MSYNPTEWVTGDIITANKLNNIEQGIVNNEPFVVELTYIDDADDGVGSKYSSNKSFSEIYTALVGGKEVVWKDVEGYSSRIMYLSHTIAEDDVIYAYGIIPYTGIETDTPEYFQEYIFGSCEMYALTMNENVDNYVVVCNSLSGQPLIYPCYFYIYKSNGTWGSAYTNYEAIWYAINHNGGNGIWFLPTLTLGLENDETVRLYLSDEGTNSTGNIIKFSGSTYDNNKIITYTAVFNSDDSIQVYKSEQAATAI